MTYEEICKICGAGACGGAAFACLGVLQRAFKLLEVAGDALLDWDSYTEETEMKMQLVAEGLIMDINTKITGKMQGQKLHIRRRHS